MTYVLLHFMHHVASLMMLKHSLLVGVLALTGPLDSLGRQEGEARDLNLIGVDILRPPIPLIGR